MANNTGDSPPMLGQLRLKMWLNKPMKVALSDGRTVVGTFLCTDCEPNIILGNTREFWLNADGKLPPDDEARCIGLTMVPAKHIVSISTLDHQS
uniref:Sm domain-containing protein n=1 Tax=Plectus sambesii TaxID=2011161 RepID=A0A914X209_9BILA